MNWGFTGDGSRYLELPPITGAPEVSPAGRARLAFNGTDVLLSRNGGAYSVLNPGVTALNYLSQGFTIPAASGIEQLFAAPEDLTIVSARVYNSTGVVANAINYVQLIPQYNVGGGATNTTYADTIDTSTTTLPTRGFITLTNLQNVNVPKNASFFFNITQGGTGRSSNMTLIIEYTPQ